MLRNRCIENSSYDFIMMIMNLFFKLKKLNDQWDFFFCCVCFTVENCFSLFSCIEFHVCVVSPARTGPFPASNGRRPAGVAVENEALLTSCARPSLAQPQSRVPARNSHRCCQLREMMRDSFIFWYIVDGKPRLIVRCSQLRADLPLLKTFFTPFRDQFGDCFSVICLLCSFSSDW